MSDTGHNMSFIDTLPSPHITWAKRAFCGADWSWDSRGQKSWKGFNLWLVVRGTGRLQVEADSYELRTGDLFLLRSWERHQGRNTSRAVLEIPYVLFNYYDQEGRSLTPDPALRLPPRHRRISNVLFYSELIERIRECGARGDDRGAQHWLNAALLEMERIDALEREALVQDPLTQLINRLCDEIRSRPGERRSLGSLAARARCTPDHFIRLFKAQVGCTPVDFIIRARIEEAASLLLFSGMPVAGIADRLGYADPFTFSKQFKAKTGLTPFRYRQEGL